MIKIFYSFRYYRSSRDDLCGKGMCIGYTPFYIKGIPKIWLSKVGTPSRDNIEVLLRLEGQLYVLFFFSSQVL